MTSVRKTALVAGVLYLVTFVAGIPPSFLYEPSLTNPLGPAAAGPIYLGAFLDLVGAFAAIGTAVALFSIVKRQHEGMALGFVTTRIMEAASILIGVVGLLTLVTLRQSVAVNIDSVASVGPTLVAVYDWTHLLGPGLMPALNAFLLGTLLYQSRLVPRAISTLGLIAAPILLISSLGILFGVNHAMSLWTGLATIPIFFWELSLGLWMVFKGFDPSAPILYGLEGDAKWTSIRPTAVDAWGQA